MFSKIGLYCIMLGLLLTLLACQDSSNDSAVQADDTLSPQAIKIIPEEIVLLDNDRPVNLVAVALDEQGDALETQPVFTWSSTDEAVATVNAEGELQAMKEGRAMIKVIAQGIENQIPVVIHRSGNNSPVNISGVIRYQDREYSTQGSNRSKQIFKSVRFALVDLVSEEGRILQTVSTDSSGRFVFTSVIPNRYIIRVISKTDDQSGYSFEVNDLSGSLYAVTQAIDITDSTPDVPMDIDDGNTAAAAFNILDVFLIGGQFVNTLTSDRIPALAAYWQPNNSRGTYFCINKDSAYCQQGAGIYIYNEGTFGDTDEFDDDVLWHEFGHFVAAHFSKDDSPGGCHLLSSNDLDLRLSWSEGWGDFFPMAIKSWLAADEQRSQLLSVAEGIPSTTYMDTAGNRTLIAIDIAAVSNTTYIYASNEISIAKILWDIVQESGMQAVWDIFYHQLPSTSTPINLEAFWDGWLARHHPDLSERRAIERIFQNRQVFYTEDRYEWDNDMSNIRKIGLGREEIHSLYQADGESDVDIVAFDGIQGVSYTVEAFNLRNGADTYLKVLPPDDNNLTMNATVVMDNDDQFENAYHIFDALCGVSRVKNNTSALSSKVTFVANLTGTYTVHVSTTPDPEPYLSAGRYGGYTLKISSQ